jgi:Mrp family chromosome partitioning ATPase
MIISTGKNTLRESEHACPLKFFPPSLGMDQENTGAGWAQAKVREALARFPAKPIERLRKNGIKRIIAVASGKGGVGKSSITALLACELARRGLKVGILDADVTGSSICRMFGVQPSGRFEPGLTKSGIKIISLQLLLKDPEQAVIWRGPIVSTAIKEMYSKLDLGELDFLLIDSPPGTSDVPLTLYQSFELDGVVLVTTPQSLVQSVVERAEKMAKKMNVPILGILENMVALKCGGCGKEHEVFGKPKGEEIAKMMSAGFLGALPIDSELSGLCDGGRVEDYKSRGISKAADELLRALRQAKA